MRTLVTLLSLLALATAGVQAQADPGLELLEAIERGEDSAWREALERRATDGDADAAYWVGRYWHDLVPLERRDYAKGREWYERAATAGSVRAAMQLGRIHETGFLVPTDRDAATVHYLRAMELGSPSAGHDLARLEFAKGEEARDGARILEYLTVAAERDHIPGVVDLAFLKASGTFGEADPAAALELARQAVAAGNGRAMNLLARMHARGLGVAADPVEALKWALLAQRHGDAAADSLVTDLAKALPESAHEQAHSRAREWLEARRGGG